MQNPYSCGIDFGTSNSTCALSTDQGIKLVTLENNSTTLPSALFFSTNGTILFGREAIQAYIEGEEGRLLRGLKSILGTSLMQEKTSLRGGAKSFVDILAIYIRNLKNKAEKFAGTTVDHVVMGRPVHFHDNNPDADHQSETVLRDIAHSVGFKNIQFQYEPIAAAFAHEQNLVDEKLSLVVDLGGGTSDFTVIRLSPHKTSHQNRAQDILATTGVRVGGTNFDQLLSLHSFMPYLGHGSTYVSEFNSKKILQMPSSVYNSLSDWSQVNFVQTAQSIRATEALRRKAIEPQQIERLLYVQKNHLGHACLQEVEKAKIELTAQPTTHRDFTSLGMNFKVDVTVAEFETTIKNSIDKITQSMHACLQQANISADAIDLVILTGGSSELPIINRLVTSTFPNAALSKENKFGSVGLGLAYNARALFA